MYHPSIALNSEKIVKRYLGIEQVFIGLLQQVNTNFQGMWTMRRVIKKERKKGQVAAADTGSNR